MYRIKKQEGVYLMVPAALCPSPEHEPQRLLEYLTLKSMNPIAVSTNISDISPTKNRRYVEYQPNHVVTDYDWLEPLFRAKFEEPMKYYEPFGDEELERWVPASPLLLHARREADIVPPLQSDIITRVRRALRHAEDFAIEGSRFEPMTLSATPGRYFLSNDGQKGTPFEPDLLAYVNERPHGQKLRMDYNRLAGEIKPSWKVASPLVIEDETHYYALIQVHYYMHQRKARYGFLLTDKELFCMLRELKDGVRILYVSPAIPLTLEGSPDEAITTFTAPLALFILCLLAADNVFSHHTAGQRSHRS